MMPTCPTWDGLGFLRDTGEDRRFCCLTPNSTGANQNLGNVRQEYLLSRSTSVTVTKSKFHTVLTNTVAARYVLPRRASGLAVY